MKMNVILRLEFELANLEAEVLHLSQYATVILYSIVVSKTNCKNKQL